MFLYAYEWVFRRILSDNILQESLKVKLGNLCLGQNTRTLCRAGINKIIVVYFKTVYVYISLWMNAVETEYNFMCSMPVSQISTNV